MEDGLVGVWTDWEIEGVSQHMSITVKRLRNINDIFIFGFKKCNLRKKFHFKMCML